MKKLILFVLIVVLACVICGCEPDGGLKDAFDWSQYNKIAATIVVTQNDTVLVEESSIIAKDDTKYIESARLKTLASLTSETSYEYSSAITEYESLDEYFSQFGLNPNNLTVQQMSRVVDIEDGRELSISLKDEEVSALFDDCEVLRKDCSVKFVFYKNENILKSLSFSYTTSNENIVLVQLEYFTE